MAFRYSIFFSRILAISTCIWPLSLILRAALKPDKAFLKSCLSRYFRDSATSSSYLRQEGVLPGILFSAKSKKKFLSLFRNRKKRSFFESLL